MEHISYVNYKIQVGREGLTLNLTGLTEEEALAVEKTLLDLNTKKAPQALKEGQVWQHGAACFHVLAVANNERTTVYPVTVVYRCLDLATPLSEIWARPKDDFLKHKTLMESSNADKLICQYYNRHNGPRYV